MAQMGEDRSGLFNEIQGFSQRKLKKVETKVITGLGEQLVEKRGAKGVQTIKSEGMTGPGFVVDNKPDLSVGLVIPGLLIGSQDAAADKDTLESMGVTHILNLAYGVENAFEEDYNYKTVQLLDTEETVLKKHFDECFEFIDEGRHYGNTLVHCNAGVSRSTAMITAYLMTKEKLPLDDALVKVKEARAFAKPNAGFMKQLREINEELFGANKKDDTIDDPFTMRKRAEIEQEKAALKSAGNIKNRIAAFGATLDTPSGDQSRARSASPSATKIHSNNNNNNSETSSAVFRTSTPL